MKKVIRIFNLPHRLTDREADLVKEMVPYLMITLRGGNRMLMETWMKAACLRTSSRSMDDQYEISRLVAMVHSSLDPEPMGDPSGKWYMGDFYKNRPLLTAYVKGTHLVLYFSIQTETADPPADPDRLYMSSLANLLSQAVKCNDKVTYH